MKNVEITSWNYGDGARIACGDVIVTIQDISDFNSVQAAANTLIESVAGFSTFEIVKAVMELKK